MEVKIKDECGYVEADWTIEDGVMVVSPKVEKYEPKNGDVVNVDGYILIFKKTRGSLAPSLYSHVTLIKNMLHFDLAVTYTKIRPATEEEKQEFFDKLEKEGWGWKADTKELVKLKWRPKLNEKYYHPILRPSNGSLLFEPITEICKDDMFSNIVVKKGWAFRTKDECQEFCNRLTDAINQIKP